MADENFNNRIVRDVLRQKPDINIVRVQDVGLLGVDAPGVMGYTREVACVRIG